MTALPPPPPPAHPPLPLPPPAIIERAEIDAPEFTLRVWHCNSAEEAEKLGDEIMDTVERAWCEALGAELVKG